ncbi:MAG: Co2+/Mg2+ efflux protein ApaG [Proteobacteria bacterium]|nr:Co2+/Mg2+ efflux protein ApaG [Pseudomonadota bacterium]
MKKFAVTHGIEVNVESLYVPEQSNVEKGEHVFAYRIQLRNLSDQTVQLISRHWIISDDEGKTSEVKGDGVVGQQPIIKPGQAFEYTSSTLLNSEVGTMEGTYLMKSESGEILDIQIPCFMLTLPFVIN